MFLELKSDQVNLSYILQHIREKWGQDYIIVTSDGQELEDCTVTQGWLHLMSIL